MKEKGGRFDVPVDKGPGFAAKSVPRAHQPVAKEPTTLTEKLDDLEGFLGRFSATSVRRAKPDARQTEPDAWPRSLDNKQRATVVVERVSEDQPRRQFHAEEGGDSGESLFGHEGDEVVEPSRPQAVSSKGNPPLVEKPSFQGGKWPDANRGAVVTRSGDQKKSEWQRLRERMFSNNGSNKTDENSGTVASNGKDEMVRKIVVD